MNFSYTDVWEDTLRLLRRHGALLAAIAGVFVFLPALAMTLFLPPPEPASPDPSQMMRVLLDCYRAAAPWFLVQSIVSLVGTAAMLRLVFAREGSVGEALVFGLLLLPFYFLLSLLSAIIVSVGFLLLIVPGLYLIGRIAPAPAVMVAEQRRNPIDALTRSFAITKGKGWAVFGMIFVVGIVGAIVTGVADTLVGIIFNLAAGRELGKMLAGVVAAALSAAFATVLLMLYAAIYRALTGAADRVARTFA